MSGNWKMHNDHLQSIRTIQDLGLRLTPADVGPLDVSVHPPFTDLRSVQTVLEDRAIPVALGAQHCFSEDAGAFTGEVAPPMLARLGVTYVIVGHSERRQLFGQTDEQVAATLRAVLRHAMTPIVCVGETAEEREGDETEARLSAQTTAALKGLPAAETAGSGPRLRAHLGHRHRGHGHRGRRPTGLRPYPGRGGGAGGPGGGPGRPHPVRGSVRPENTVELMNQRDIDGLLVGGASLDAAAFAAIVRQAGTTVR